MDKSSATPTDNSSPNVFEPVVINGINGTANGNVSQRSANEINGNPDLNEFFARMRNEKDRLGSFTNSEHRWPLSFLDPKDLANAGFFYLLNSDRVQCAFCRGVVCNWEQGDIPLMEHMRHYPRCPFLLEYNVGNVPIGEDPIRGSNVTRPRDVCGNNHTSSNNTSNHVTVNIEEDKKVKVYSLPVSVNLRELGVRPHQGAKSIAYISLESRLNSFANWPQSAKVKPEKLADAGFFYIGVGDYVKCYYCDGGLCHWDPSDDPWTEHARWFPDCGYVLLNKGYAFVESCRQKFGDGLSHTTSSEEDALTVKVINEWFQSELVKQLFEIHKYPVDVVKAALHQRWLEKQQPFEHLGELNEAVIQSLNVKGQESPNEKNNENSQIGDSHLSSSPETSSPLESYESNPSTSSSPSSSQSNGEREERLRCKICLDREVGVLFLPCGHVVTCTQCAPGISDCPICRKVIKGVVRTFFS